MLRRDLPEFAIRTAQEQGWAGYRNGELLGRVAAEFDVLVTLDQRMRYQQNLSRFEIGIVVMDVRDTRLVRLRELLADLRTAIATVRTGEVVIVPPIIWTS